MNPELLTVIFTGVTSSLALWFKYKTDSQSTRIQMLQDRVEHLEEALATSDQVKRAALSWARQITAWAHAKVAAIQLGEIPPEKPIPPDLIKEEV